MGKIGLIIEREYKNIVFKKSFIFTTILMPILMVALCGVLPIFLSNVKSDTQKVVAVIDNNPGQSYAEAIQDTEDYTFVKIKENVEDGNSLYNYYKEQSEPYYAIVQIPNNLSTERRFYVFSETSINSSLERTINNDLRPILRAEKVESYGIEGLDQIMKECDVNLESKSIKWGEEGKETLSSASVAEMIGLVLAFLTYFFVLMYGAMIMNGVVEEKTNRIVEVIVSACKPMELMMGKIIGVALVGFTQIVIWAVLLGIGGTILGAGFMIGGGTDPTAMATAMGADPAAISEAMAAAQPQIDNQFGEILEMILSINYIQILVYFVLYFIGGYLLYASLFAAFGSAVDQPSDTSQFMGPIMIIMIFAFYAGIFSIENPDGPLAWWCSIIPFTSPIVMMIRLPFDIPFWELSLSIILLYATALCIIWMAGRIYRKGILMYGKKFSFKDIMKWIR